ncbi:MAG: DoxX family protein [Planctomycetota bacterium]
MAMSGISRVAPIPLRLAAGATLCVHGYQTLFLEGEFQQWTEQVATFGFPQSNIIAHVMAWGALAGGALLILGFVTRLAALLNSATLLVLIWKTVLTGDILHDLRYKFAGTDGYEGYALLLAVCLCLLLCGAGTLSVDSLLMGRRSSRGAAVE